MKLTAAETMRNHSTTLATVGTIVLLAAVFYGSTRNAPLALSQASWTTIRGIESSDTPYAADVLSSARRRHNTAWVETQRQLNRPRPLRSFYRAEILFLQAMGLARTSQTVGQWTQDRAQRRMLSRVAAARRELARLENELQHSLQSVSLRSLATRAGLKVGLAEQHLADGGLTERAIDDAEEAITALRVAMRRNDGMDSAMVPVWDDWSRETLEWTRLTDSAAVLVVKETHCGYLLRGGMVVSSFPIELGYRSGSQKMHAGDGATPEGMFRIVARRDSGAAYYRALDLDYPTFPDSIRYHVAQKLGNIPADRGIGGNIQIHGEGGRHIDWTDGCVAVTNDQMDMLMERLDVGDRVTIVRQLNGWPE